ncbi:hypothetical protein CMK14_28220 [Candidatus Poribacteria bacterium]|nr:hypothetical protein [Candidatus Poribacteria bacterium]
MNLKRYYRWKSLGLPTRMSIVLSFQAFAEPVKYLGQWYQASGKPVLWADGSHRRETIQDDSGKYLDGEYYLVDRKWFAETIENLLQNVGIVGAHLCSGYIRNRYRRKGLIDEEEQPDEIAISKIPIDEAKRLPLGFVNWNLKQKEQLTEVSTQRLRAENTD